MARTTRTTRTPSTRRMVPDASKVKQQMAQHIARTIAGDNLTQTEAARLLRDAPSQLSLINTGRLRGISAERLISLLARQGYDVVVTVARAHMPARGKQRVGSIAFYDADRPER